MKKLKPIVSILLLAALIVSTAVFGVDHAVVASARGRITDADRAGSFGADCILVLGCRVEGERLSLMLSDRMETAVRLYRAGAAPKLLLSGDHGRVDYDEVNAMLAYAREAGVPEEDVFLDHAGFCTYDSIYRAKHVFAVERMIVVTQEYHLYRALYIAGQVGIEAVGVSTGHVFSGQRSRDVRELFARDKDFFACLFRVRSRYLGDVIPIGGSGLPTRDR